MGKFNTLTELDDDTLAKLTSAAAAGIVTAVLGKKIYKKYKENQILKKYGSQEKKVVSDNDIYTNAVLDLVDINTTRQLASIKR
jgi:hypothetical protein